MHLETCFEWRVHCQKIRKKVILNGRVRVKPRKNKGNLVKRVKAGIIDG